MGLQELEHQVIAGTEVTTPPPAQADDMKLTRPV